jgi:hypothetical protein
VPIFCVCQIQVRSHPRTYGKTHKGIFVPSIKGLEGLADEAPDRKNCGLWQHASETIFGKARRAPKSRWSASNPGTGDVEGNPFVGPADKLLDTLLVEAGIDRGQVYVTNAVKHFNGNRGARRPLALPAGRGSFVLQCSQVGKRREQQENQRIVKSRLTSRLVGPLGFEPRTNGL